MPGGTRRAYFESPPRPDWRKRALAEGRATVFTPAELRSMGFKRKRALPEAPHNPRSCELCVEKPEAPHNPRTCELCVEKRPIVVVVRPAKTGRTSRYTRRAPRRR